MMNMLKYYLGLPAKTVAPRDRLPQGALLTVSNLLHLAMVYEHDKAATDVNCVAEVSPNLAAWFSGPSYTAIADVADLGVRERVSVRDLTPVSAAASRFMRLRLARQFP